MPSRLVTRRAAPAVLALAGALAGGQVRAAGTAVNITTGTEIKNNCG